MPEIELRFRGSIPADIEDPQAKLVFHREYLLAFEESLKTLRDMVRERTPIGASGMLRASIGYQMIDLTAKDSFGFLAGPPQFDGKVFSRSKTEYFLGLFPGPIWELVTYARPVEFGTAPHWPPVDAISYWAGRVLNLYPMEAYVAAFRIARSISIHGTRGRFMFRDARQAFQASGILERNFSLATSRARSQVEVQLPWWAES